MLSDNCATNTNLKKWGGNEHDRCPRCGDPEDKFHAIRCKQNQAMDCWTKKTHTLRQWLEKERTNPLILKTIIKHLEDLKQDTPTNSPPPEFVRQAVEEQNNIGWENFTMGIISSRWQVIQARHYKYIKTKKSSKRWTTMLIRKPWEMSWDQWQHCCRILHNPRQSQCAADTNLDEAIHDQIQEGAPTHCPPHWRTYFTQRSRDVIPQKTAQAKKRWLNLVRRICDASANLVLTPAQIQADQDEQDLRGMQGTMRRWLTQTQR